MLDKRARVAQLQLEAARAELLADGARRELGSKGSVRAARKTHDQQEQQQLEQGVTYPVPVFNGASVLREFQYVAGACYVSAPHVGRADTNARSELSSCLIFRTEGSQTQSRSTRLGIC